MLPQDPRSFPGTPPALELPPPGWETRPPAPQEPPPAADPGSPGVVSPTPPRSVLTPWPLPGALQPLPGQGEESLPLFSPPAEHKPHSKVSPALSQRSQPAAGKELQPPGPPQPLLPLRGAAKRPEQAQVVGFYPSPPSRARRALTPSLARLSWFPPSRMCQWKFCLLGKAWSPPVRLGALRRARLPVPVL